MNLWKTVNIPQNPVLEQWESGLHPAEFIHMNNSRAFCQTVCVNKANKSWPVPNIVHWRLQQSKCNYVRERKAAGAIPKGRTSLRFRNKHIFPRDPEETRTMDFLRPDSYVWLHTSKCIFNCSIHLKPIKFLRKWTGFETGPKIMSSPSSYTTWNKALMKKNPRMELHDNLALDNHHAQFSLDNIQINDCVARGGSCYVLCWSGHCQWEESSLQDNPKQVKKH